MPTEISPAETADKYDRLLLLINAVTEDNAKVNKTLADLAKEMNRVVVMNNQLILQADDGRAIRDTLFRYLGLVIVLLIIIVGGVLLKDVFLSYNKKI